MRFKEFLLREEMQDFDIVETLSKIKHECEHIIAECHEANQFLYRGMKIPSVDRGIFLPHLKEREPKDSSGGFNIMFNAGIECAFDIPMVRKTSVFCTGSLKEVGTYGNRFFLFPRGEFEFVWSPGISDSYSEDSKIFRIVAEKLSVGFKNYLTPSVVEDVFNNIHLLAGGVSSGVDAIMHDDDDLIKQAVKSLDYGDASSEEIKQALKTIFKGLYTTHGMSEAIKSKHEIMLTKTNGYYAIPREGLQHMIHDREDLDGQSPEEYLENYFFHGRGA